MKILHIISSTNPIGGGPIEAIEQIGLVLNDWGHANEILCLDAPNSPWLSKLPLTTHAVGSGRAGYAYSKHFVPWLREHATQYDAVIVHGIWQYSSFGTWLALHNLNTPYFVYVHGMLDPWFKRTYPLKHLKKWLYWTWADYRVLRDAKAVIFTCEEERVLARESFWLYKCREVVVNLGIAAPIGNPTVHYQNFFRQFPELEGRRLLLFLGRIHVKKGCDLLIEAFAKVASQDDSLHLVMAGPDRTGWQTELEQQVQKLGIAHKITWTGMLLRERKWDALYAAELLVLPSHQENFGIVVAEAMACSVPVLISNKVNIWQEITFDGAGLVANDDLDGTTEMLQKWLAMPPRDRQQMKQKAKQCFTQRFEIHQVAQSLVNTLHANGVNL